MSRRAFVHFFDIKLDIEFFLMNLFYAISYCKFLSLEDYFPPSENPKNLRMDWYLCLDHV